MTQRAPGRWTLAALLAVAALAVPPRAAADDDSASEPPPPALAARCPDTLAASLSLAVDADERRVYLRLVLANRGEAPLTVPLTLNRHPCYPFDELLLVHADTGTEVRYPGEIRVVWTTAGPTLAPGDAHEIPFSLSPAWFEHEGRWSAVWRRVRGGTTSSDPAGEAAPVWVDVSERIEFVLPPGFLGSPATTPASPPSAPAGDQDA